MMSFLVNVTCLISWGLFSVNTTPSHCMWERLRINYRLIVHCNEETCHTMQQCGSCFYLFLDKENLSDKF